MPMRLRLSALVLLIPLAACGHWHDSKMNPGNWFGHRHRQAAEALDTTPAADPRPLVDKLLSLQVEPFPGGVIVRATGLPPTQGFWNAELVALPVDDKGMLVLEFHLVAPATPADVINQQSREITVAHTITAFQLQTIKRVEVRGANNALAKSL